MNESISWDVYVRALSTNQSEIAERANTSQSTVSRWLTGTTVPDARQVIALARAYSVSPLAALVAAGYLRPEELAGVYQVPAGHSITQYTDLELAVEMLRRVDTGDSPELESPLDSNHPAMQEHIAAVRPLRDVGGYLDDAVHELDTAAGTDETQADDD